METQEYFQEIAKKVSEKRGYSQYSQAEKEAYEEGKKSALRGVLIETSLSFTYAELMQRLVSLQKFLEAERQRGKLATKENMAKELWEKPLSYSSVELANFVGITFQDYRTRLKKAREVHAVNIRLLHQYTQLSIEGEPE